MVAPSSASCDAGQELRRRMHDNVGSLVERAEIEGRGDGRVADDEAAVRAQSIPVRQRQDRVRGRFDPHDVGRRRRLGLVELDELQPPRLEHAEEHARPEVRALGQRDRLPGACEREDDRGRRGRSRGVEQRVAALELAESRFRLDTGRVVVPRVVELARLALVVVGPDRGAVGRLHHRNLRGRRPRDEPVELVCGVVVVNRGPDQPRLAAVVQLQARIRRRRDRHVDALGRQRGLAPRPPYGRRR